MLAAVVRVPLVVDPVDRLHDELERTPDAVRRNRAFELEGRPDLPAELLGQVGADHRAAPLVDERPASPGRSSPYSGNIARYGSASTAKLGKKFFMSGAPVAVGTPPPNQFTFATRFMPGMRGEPRLVGQRQAEHQADAVPHDEPFGARAVHVAVEGAQQCLKRADEEDAERHREDGAEGADPVLPQVLQDVGEVFHVQGYGLGAPGHGPSDNGPRATGVRPGPSPRDRAA